jgi:hypothetical protein
MPSDKRKGQDYVDVILGGPLWDYYVSRYDVMGAALVMEDGAPVHRAKIVYPRNSQISSSIFYTTTMGVSRIALSSAKNGWPLLDITSSGSCFFTHGTWRRS